MSRDLFIPPKKSIIFLTSNFIQNAWVIPPVSCQIAIQEEPNLLFLSLNNSKVWQKCAYNFVNSCMRFFNCTLFFSLPQLVMYINDFKRFQFIFFCKNTAITSCYTFIIDISCWKKKPNVNSITLLLEWLLEVLPTGSAKWHAEMEFFVFFFPFMFNWEVQNS